MTDFCSTWRNQTSHPLIDFAACRCDGKDIAGLSAHEVCAYSAVRVVCIIAPFVVIAVVCWFRGVKRGLEEVGIFSLALIVGAIWVPLYGFPVLFLPWLIRHLIDFLQWSTAYAGVCLDRVICHLRMQRHANKRSTPSAPIVQCPILPIELCDTIISFCTDPVLLSCSLVCAAWVPMSRKQLRLEFRFTSYKRTMRLNYILRSPLETLSPWVTAIELGVKSDHQQWRLLHLLKLKGFQPQRATLWHRGRLAHHLLEIYPDLPSLTFHVLAWKKPAGELRTFLTTVLLFKHLRSLTIEMGNVEHDYLLSDNFSGNEDASETLHVSHLSLGGKSLSSLLTWLQTRCHRLETLDIHAHSVGPAACLQSLMMSNWQTLEHLGLAVPSTGDLVTNPPNLSSLKHLTSIHLSLDFKETTAGSVDCAMTMLRTVDSSNRLTELRLQSAPLNFTANNAAAFDEIIVGRLGLNPVAKESNLYSYVGTAAAAET